MQVHTTRFGVLDIADDRVLEFPKGLLGFSQHTRFCLLEPGQDACFFWLQCVDEPSLAFVVTDPSLFVP
jgi:flagellar assembly factor FliW